MHLEDRDRCNRKVPYSLCPWVKKAFISFWYSTGQRMSWLACQNVQISYSASVSHLLFRSASLKIVSISRAVIFRHVAHKVTYCGAFWRRNLSLFWYTFGYCHFLVHFWRVWQIYTSNTGNKLRNETTQPRWHPGLSYWVNCVFAN